MTPKSSTKAVKTKAELEAENELLRKQLSEKSNQSVGIELKLDELIPVMSLLNYTLNLSTLGGGKGKIIKFEKFGELKLVLYQDLLDVMESYRSFMEHGYFVILDERVINRHGLQEMYSKILNKEKIEEILDGEEGALRLYKSSTPEQQKVIVGMIVEKISKNSDGVNLNVVDQISRASGVDIAKKAEDAKAYFSPQEVEAE